jgi:hypothetical protein
MKNCLTMQDKKQQYTQIKTKSKKIPGSCPEVVAQLDKHQVFVFEG